MRRHLPIGIQFALASAALFGFGAPVAKWLLASTPPQMLAGLTYLGAGCGLAIVRAGGRVLRMPSPEAPLRARDFGWLAAIVAIGGVIAPLCLMLGLARSDAASASLLLNLESIATMAIAWLVFRENVDGRLLLGAFAIVFGAMVLSWTGQGVAFNAGAALIALACLGWGVDNNLTRKLSAADPVTIAMIKGLAAGAVNIGIAVARGEELPNAPLIAMAALLGFITIGVSLAFFVAALRHLGAARTGAYFSLAPFIGAVASIALLRETPTIQLGVAALLMGLGLWLHLAERHDHEHEHEPLEHDHLHSHDEHHQHSHDGPLSEPHSHWHRHEPMRHRHPHYPDLHHRHSHDHAPADVRHSGAESH